MKKENRNIWNSVYFNTDLQKKKKKKKNMEKHEMTIQQYKQQIILWRWSIDQSINQSINQFIAVHMYTIYIKENTGIGKLQKAKEAWRDHP